MRLHDNLSSGNGYKARLLLTQLGIPFERIEYDIDRGETRTPEFLEKVSSNGRVPVLELDDGRMLSESGAILFYLAEGTPFLADGRYERAQTLQWMFFEQYSHEPNIATPRFWITHNVEMTGERRILLVGKRKLGYDALGVMERHLEEHDFFVADRYSVADIALYAYTHVAGEVGVATESLESDATPTSEGGFDLSGFPAVGDWLERVRTQPGHIPITQG